MIFPFISYLEGSYFGDSDSLIPGQKTYERDSTAVADLNCQLYILSKDFIMSLKRTFGREIKEMEHLAVSRKKWHKKLLSVLYQKVQII